MNGIWFRIRFCACLLILTAAFIIRFSVGGPLAELRDSARKALSDGARYKDAVEAFGRAFSGEKDALEVFGRKFLVISEASD